MSEIDRLCLGVAVLTPFVLFAWWVQAKIFEFVFPRLPIKIQHMYRSGLTGVDCICRVCDPAFWAKFRRDVARLDEIHRKVRRKP